MRMCEHIGHIWLEAPGGYRCTRCELFVPEAFFEAASEHEGGERASRGRLAVLGPGDSLAGGSLSPNEEGEAP